MVRLAACACLLLACGARSPAPALVSSGDDVTLYRDWAVVRQRIEIRVPAAPTTVEVEIAAGIAADQVMVLDRGGLAIRAVHADTDPSVRSEAPLVEPAVEESDGDAESLEVHAPIVESPPVAEPIVAVRRDAKPTKLRLDVTPVRAGTYAIVIGYITNRLRWDVAYTMSANPRRDRGVLRGALAIRNTTGVRLRAAHARVVDAELGPWRGKTAEALAASLVGGTPSSTAPAAPRELGAIDLGAGETRVDLVRATPRSMRSVLVYDPIGTKLDNPAPAPLREAALGLEPPPGTRVAESFEVARDVAASTGLPAGPVRLLEHRDDGSLVVLGESRLFEAAARVANVDTIAVGTADRVTGTRQRRELTIDDERHRIVEEFVITLDNQRDVPASVLVREHLYRGQNWTLAYHSAAAAAKEGAQQIALRADVPARSQLKILYVVVYTWGQ